MKFFKSKWIGVFAAVVLLAAAAWYLFPGKRVNGASSPDLESAISLQVVSVMKIETGPSVFVPQRYTATVVARRRSSLSFQASERIDEILVDEGDTVKKGQLLARQDRVALEAQYGAAVARARQSRAVLLELEKGPREETIQASRAEMTRLRAQLRLADATLKRQAELRRSRASSAQEFDAARFDRDATTAAIESAQQRLDELEAGTRTEQIQAQRAAVEVSESLVAQAKARLDQTDLFAPFDGQISRRMLDEGSLPARGVPLLDLIESGNLEIRFGVSPEIALELQPGRELQFSTIGQTSSIDSGELTRGVVQRIQPTLDRETRTRLVIVSVPVSQAGKLVDGQTVHVEFAIKQKDAEGFWVPSEALQPQVRGLWSLLVVDAKSETATAQRRDVETLATWGTWSRVRGTLQADDLVIIAGANRVSSGQQVNATIEQIARPWQNGTQSIGVEQ